MKGRELEPWQREHLKKKLKGEIDLQGTEDLALTDNPDSTIQALIKETYEILRDSNGEPDCFDKFYENSLKHYGAKWRYAEFVAELLDKMNVHEDFTEEELKSEEVEKALFRIAEKIGEEPGALRSVTDVVTSRYEELVSDNPEGMSPAEYRDRYESFIDREVKKMAEGIEPSEKFTDYFDEFKALNDNDIDTVASRLNRMVDLGQDVWKLMLYSSLSAPAEKFIMGERPTRSSIHTLLIGDISTAKSKALGIINDIAPQSEKVDDMTKASFIGSYDTTDQEIKQGVVDRIINGNLIIEEYDKIEKHQGLMRVVFDNNSLNVTKGQDTKSFDSIPTSILAGANPKNDFFTTQEKALRGQVPFDEGELSRFDVLIPLTNTAEQMEKYTENMDLFGSRTETDLSDVRKMMNALSTKIQEVNEVDISDELSQKIKQGFNNLQEELNGNDHRPTLIIMRDFETLARLIYIIGCVYQNPDENGRIKVDEQVVSKALSQFETLIDLRRRLYTETDRQKLANTTKDEIYWKLVTVTEEKDSVKKNELKDTCLKDGIVQNKQTFYNQINELIREERVVEVDEEKERYTRVKPVA